ncbi:MAG: hypothetical protein V4864_01650 [Pseudomonadota bacterium]
MVDPSPISAQAQLRLQPDPDVKPPEYRVPRGRSGVGATSALDQLMQDLERVRRAKAYYGDLQRHAIDPLL